MKFPTNHEILADLVSEESYTRRGQRKKAEWLVNFAKTHSLGNARIADFPEEAVYAKEQPKPCNVVIDIGNPQADELVVFHGHFDTVPLDSALLKNYKETGRDPHDLSQHLQKKDVYYGLGGYDMLSGIVAIMRSLKELEGTLPPFRRVRAVLVCGEENDSEGTHAALLPGHNLFEGVTGVVSTEIAVNAKLNPNRRLIVIGRPGRIALDLKILGEAMHIGAVSRKNMDGLLSRRVAKVLSQLHEVELGTHPEDPKKILDVHSLCIPKEFSSSHTSAITTAGEADIRIEVPYTSPHLTTSGVVDLVRQHVHDILGDDHFMIRTMKGRQLPFTKPWLESLDDPNRPFVPQAIQIVKSQCIQQSENIHISVVGGKGVADEGIIANHAATPPTKGTIPVICLSPDGQNEHTEHEAVNIRSIDDFLVPGLLGIARSKKRYTA